MTTGCSLLSKAVNNSSEAKHDEELADLEANDKYDGLSELCSSRKRGACDARDRVAAKRLASSTCDDLESNVKAYYSNHDGTKDGDAELVGKFEQCGKVTALFQFDFSIRWLPEALAAVDASTGGDVFGPFVDYLASGGANSVTADVANRWARWIVTSEDETRCPILDAQWDQISADAKGEFLWSYFELGCGTQAAPRARARLTSDASSQRIQACDVLGSFGTDVDLEALDILAQSDPERAERELRASNGAIAIEVYYPVRERCEGAAGKVRLRASTAAR